MVAAVALRGVTGMGLFFLLTLHLLGPVGNLVGFGKKKDQRPLLQGASLQCCFLVSPLACQMCFALHILN